MVLSYEVGDSQPLVSATVVRLFKSEVDNVIAFHGMNVTTGHLFASDNGNFVKLVELLKQDGLVILSNGTKVRARTNLPAGSIEDQAIPVSCRDGAVRVLRAGLPYGRRQAGGETFTIAAKMAHYGYRIRDDGLFENDAGDVRMAAWEWGDPREHPVARNYVVGGDYQIAELETVN